jgi:hypothetical protein
MMNAIIQKIKQHFKTELKESQILKILEHSKSSEWSQVKSKLSYDYLPPETYLKTVLVKDYKDLSPVYFGGGPVYAREGAIRYYKVLPKGEEEDCTISYHLPSGNRVCISLLKCIDGIFYYDTEAITSKLQFKLYRYTGTM